MIGADPGEVLRRRAVLLGGVDDGDADHEQDRHRREDRPSLPAAADHPAVGRGQRSGDQQHRQHLDEVGEAARVLERHRRVDVEEPAAVGAELLDDLLRGHRAEPDRLRSPDDGVCGHVAAEVLDHALGDEQERPDDRDRQQDVEQRPDQVLPEVPEAVAAARDDAPDQRDDDGDADGCGDEVLHRQPGHLAEVRHRRLAAVELPVRVRDERRDGVEGHVPRARVKALGIERVQRLRAQDQIQREPEQRGEDQQAAGVGLPVLPTAHVHPKRAVEQPLERPDHGREEHALAREHARHVAAQQRRERHEHRDEQRDLQRALQHQSLSPRSSA